MKTWTPATTAKKWPASPGFNTLDNWDNKTPTQSKRKRTEKKRLKGHGPEHVYNKLDYINKKNVPLILNPTNRFICSWLQNLLIRFFFFLLMVQKERKGSLWHLSPLNTSINHLLVSLQMTALHLLQDHELFIWLWNMFTVPKKNHFWYCLILFCHYKLCIT